MEGRRHGRRRPLEIIAAIAVVTLGLLLPSFLGPALAQNGASFERNAEEEFYDRISALRASEGLEPLRRHPALVAESRAWAEQLEAEGVIRHASDLSIGVDEQWFLLGENVGTTDETIEVLFDAFVASPTHLANLVEPSFDSVGVGVVVDERGQVFTVHRFMDAAEVPASPASLTPLLDELDRSGI